MNKLPHLFLVKTQYSFFFLLQSCPFFWKKSNLYTIAMKLGYIGEENTILRRV